MSSHFRTRFATIFTIVWVISIVMGLFAGTAGAGNHGGGNAGTVMVDQVDIDSGGGNEPQKTECTFELDFFNFAVPGSATYSFTLQSPTQAPGGNNQLLTGNVTFHAPDPVTGRVGESGLIDLAPSIFASGAQPLKGKGWHITLDVTTPQGGKSKTYWVDGCVSDLGITKTANRNSIQLGTQQVTHTITATNAGPMADTNVVVTDSLPAGLTLVSATWSGPGTGACAGLTCTIATLASGASVQLVTVSTGNALGNQQNTATVDGTRFDPDPLNDSASHTTTVTAAPALSTDLRVTKTDGRTSVLGGTRLDYTLTVTNNGPDGATGVSVVDTIPTGTTLITAGANAPNPSQGSCPTTTPTTVTCNLGALANGASATITISVNTPVVLADTVKTNSATVSGAQVDPAPLNNTGTDDTTLTAAPPPPETDLRVTKTDGQTSVVGGTRLNYTLTVTNNGPDAATGVSVTDTIPTGTTLVTAAPNAPAASQGSCPTITVNTVTCNLGNLANGASATITISVDTSAVLADTVKTNSATVSGGETDPTPGNNTGTDNTTLTPPPPGPPPPAGTGTVTIKKLVNGAGADQNLDFTFNDTLPNGNVDPQSHNDLVQTFTNVAIGNYTVTETNVPNNWALTGVTCTGDGDSTGSAAAGASIDVDAGDTINCTFTNTYTAPAPPCCLPPAPTADVSLTKTDLVDPVVAGQNITYTVSVTNNGPNTAVGVTVTDTLPAGTGFVSATPSVGTCSNSSPISCSLGDLTSGQNVTITVVASTSSSTPASVTNTASASSSTGDPNGANNTDNETTTVVPPLGPQQGRIVLQKQTLPNRSTETFDFTGDLPATLGDGQTAVLDVDAGTYTATEVAEEGWLLTGISCDDSDSSGDKDSATATFVVAEGETVKCTFTNTEEDVLPTGPINRPDPDLDTDPAVPDQGPKKILPAVKPGVLPFTGSDPSGLAALASLLMLSGATLVLAGRGRSDAVEVEQE